MRNRAGRECQDEGRNCLIDGGVAVERCDSGMLHVGVSLGVTAGLWQPLPLVIGPDLSRKCGVRRDARAGNMPSRRAANTRPSQPPSKAPSAHQTTTRLARSRLRRPPFEYCRLRRQQRRRCPAKAASSHSNFRGSHAKRGASRRKRGQIDIDAGIWHGREKAQQEREGKGGWLNLHGAISDGSGMSLKEGRGAPLLRHEPRSDHLQPGLTGRHHRRPQRGLFGNQLADD